MSTLPATSLAAESLLSLAVTVTSEQRVESVLQSIVQGLASQPGVALARIWLLPSVHLPSSYHAVSNLPDCLCLVASAGTPLDSSEENWCFLQGHFARVPFNVGKVGQVAASRHPILIEDVAAQNDWVVRPEWAKREEIRSFAGHPLIFRDQLLGVIAVFSRQPLGEKEFTWLGLFANQAAVAIANACTEEALQSSERNLAALVNTIPTAAWTTRPDGYCDFLNRVWLDYTGMTAEQAQGWGWSEAIHPNDHPKLVEEWKSCLASGTPVDTEARIRRYDSSYRWFLIRGNPLKDERGNILKWYGTCIDIEDRKRGEEALRTRELSWRQIVDNIPGLVGTTGAMGEVEFLNRQTLEYFGKTTQELKDWALIDAVHTDDLSRVIEARKKSIETGQIYDVEHRCRRADGVYRWFQVRGLPARTAEGTITAWYLLLTDIDDRKRAEEALRTRELDARSLLDNMPGFLARLSPDGTPEIFNRPFLQYLGKTAEETKKWKTNDIIHPDDLADTIEIFGNAISKGQLFDVEHRVRRFDGVYRWFQNRAVPVRDGAGRVLHWNVLVTDIDDRKKAEEALQSNEHNLSVMINTIPALIHTGRPDGYLDYFNRPWLEYLGVTLDDMVGWNWRAVIHPEDVEGIVARWRACLATGETFEYETRVRRADGQYRWMLHCKVPLRDATGKILKWYGSSVDIDDNKKSESRLRQVIDTIPTLAWTMLPDGSNEFLSKRWEEYTGLSVDESHGWGWQAAFHPDDLPVLLKKWQQLLGSGQAGEEEARLRYRDGVYRWFLIRVEPFRDETGKILRWYGTSTDIEDRKQAELALQSSERNLNQMINAIPAVVGVMRPDGTPLYGNQAVMDYTGLTMEDMLKDDFRTRLFHPEDMERLREARKVAFSRPLAFENEQRALGKNGKYRWFLFRYKPLLDEAGKIDRWYMAATDIEDRKRAEEALHARELDARSLLDNMPGFLARLSPDGIPEIFNPPFLQYLGRTPEEIGQWRMNEIVHPDDLAHTIEVFGKAISTGQPFNLEYRLRRFDGVYRWFQASGVPVRDAEGRILHWNSLVTDIDDRKRAESQVEQSYLRLTEAQTVSKTGSFITDLVTDEHNFSDEAFRIFEFDPAVKVNFLMVRNTIHPEDQPTFDAVIARAMTGTDVEFEFRIVTSRGAMKHLRGMARVLGKSEGHPVFIGALQDVTEKKLAEEALDKARSELAHVARVATLSALTASIAHEVNQPLSGIITNASTCRRMLDGDPPNIEGARETARRIIRDGNRASDVITRLRALFSKKDFVLEPLDLNEATREVIALSLSDFQRNRVILLSELAEELPPVMGDRIQLQQVTLNLFRNACDAMLGVDDRARELRVRTKWDEGNRVRLSVIDSGVGFPPETADKLFEAFHTTKTDGMGIGLSVSRSIIERHQGRLWAEPNVGSGATFSFSIPCAPCGPRSATGEAS